MNFRFIAIVHDKFLLDFIYVCARYWICNFPLHFDMDSKVTAAVNRLSSLLQAEGNYKLKELVDVSKV